MKKVSQIVVVLLCAILYSCSPSEVEEKLNKHIADSIGADKVADELGKSLESAMSTNKIVLDTTIDNTHLVIKKDGVIVDTAATEIRGRVNSSNTKYSIKDIAFTFQTKPFYDKKRKEKSYTISFKDDGTISGFWIENNSICNFDLTIGNNKSIKFTQKLDIGTYDLNLDVQ